jgi:2-oxoglutarate ferredoxin oxidoreductase subunit beta
VNRLDFISSREEITTSYMPGETRSVMLHDGGTIRLHKLNDDYDPSDRVGAMSFIELGAPPGRS